MHIAPRTVELLRSLGHDVLRVDEILPANAPDNRIVETAREHGRAVLTQDLDFSALVALGGTDGPSVISLRLSSSRVEAVNRRLAAVLPALEDAVRRGAIVTVEDGRHRVRRLPVE